MDWADSSGFLQVLDDISCMREVFRAYVEYLRDRVLQNKLSNNSAAQQLEAVKCILADLFAIDDLGRGLFIPRRSHRYAHKTLPPDDDNKSKVLILCSALFQGIFNLVVNGLPYPHLIKVPDFVDVLDNKLWIFPTSRWLMTLSMEKERHTMGVPAWPYNYSSGKLYTCDELKLLSAPKYDSSNRTRQIIIDGGARQLKAANKDLQHVRRRQLACVALNVFIPLFLAETGMNWSTLISLPWDDKFEIEYNNQNFRAVKWRAGGRLVSFEVSAKFISVFNNFLAVRDYLLQGKICGYLFFTLGSNSTENAKQISVRMENTSQLLRRLCPDLVSISSRQWRAAKSDWLVRNTDVATTALMLQNSEKTVSKHYAEGSMTVHVQEMSNFLELISSTVVKKNEKIEDGVVRAVGVCSSFNKPVPNAEISYIKADCIKPEGCLFCNKLKIHADESDARKIISCRYFLQKTSCLIGNEQRAEKFLAPVLARIEQLLAEMSEIDAELVERVISEVDDEGEFDAYWGRKIEMLMELGLLS
jgi:hypothetical protein